MIAASQWALKNFNQWPVPVWAQFALGPILCVPMLWFLNRRADKAWEKRMKDRYGDERENEM